MGFREKFERYYLWLEWPLQLIAVLSLAYYWWSLGEVEWHSLLNIVAVLFVGLVAIAGILARQLRKRRNTGIVRFQWKHRPIDAVAKLKGIEKRYLYIGRSFESMLDVFEQARQKGGMAQCTHLQLLLADPDDEDQIEYLRKNTPGIQTAHQTREDLRRRLERTLASVSDFGCNLEIRVHAHATPFRGWLHLFDEDSIMFGMTPRGSDGLVSPAMELEPVKGRWTLFDHMLDWAEDSWNRATKKEDLLLAHDNFGHKRDRCSGHVVFRGAAARLHGARLALGAKLWSRDL